MELFCFSEGGWAGAEKPCNLTSGKNTLFLEGLKASLLYIDCMTQKKSRDFPFQTRCGTCHRYFLQTIEPVGTSFVAHLCLYPRAGDKASYWTCACAAAPALHQPEPVVSGAEASLGGACSRHRPVRPGVIYAVTGGGGEGVP